MPLSEQQLAEMAALEAKATPGPWAATEMQPLNDGYYKWCEVGMVDPDITLFDMCIYDHPNYVANAEFAAAARAFVPAAIAEIQRLRGLLKSPWDQWMDRTRRMERQRQGRDGTLALPPMQSAEPE